MLDYVQTLHSTKMIMLFLKCFIYKIDIVRGYKMIDLLSPHNTYNTAHCLVVVKVIEGIFFHSTERWPGTINFVPHGRKNINNKNTD